MFEYTWSHTSLRAASGYVQNQHPINALNPICLSSFRNKSAQSSGQTYMREQNWGRIAYYSAHRAVIFATVQLSCTKYGLGPIQ